MLIYTMTMKMKTILMLTGSSMMLMKMIKIAMIALMMILTLVYNMSNAPPCGLQG